MNRPTRRPPAYARGPRQARPLAGFAEQGSALCAAGYAPTRPYEEVDIFGGEVGFGIFEKCRGVRLEVLRSFLDLLDPASDLRICFYLIPQVARALELIWG